MIASSATYQTVDDAGNYTARNLIQNISHNLKAATLHFRYELEDSPLPVVLLNEFRLTRDNANILIAALNGTVSVGFRATNLTLDTVEDGSQSGLLSVMANNIAKPQQTSPIRFVFVFSPTGGVALPAIPFQLSHVDASLLVGLMNAVANTN